MGIKKKTIYCTSDIHGCIEKLSIPECDLLLIAGDFSKFGKKIYKDANWLASHFSQWLRRQPAKNIVMIPGNHDVVFDVAKSIVPKLDCEILIDKYIEIDGIKIYGSPWSVEFYNWGFNLSEEKLSLVWEQIPEGLDFLLVHCPPYGILDETQHPNYVSRHIGSPSLKARIKKVKPKYVIFGHNHGQPGIVEEDGITFINATLLDDSLSGKIANPPTLIEFEYE